jgi:hypothetical protein
MKITLETDKYVYYEYEPGYKETKEKKFLCIGGPHAGLLKARVQLEGQYYAFNNSGNCKISMIYVHKDLLA